MSNLNSTLNTNLYFLQAYLGNESEPVLPSCILFMDSFDLHNGPVIAGNCRRYLAEEFRVKRGDVDGSPVSVYDENTMPLVQCGIDKVRRTVCRTGL